MKMILKVSGYFVPGSLDPVMMPAMTVCDDDNGVREAAVKGATIIANLLNNKHKYYDSLLAWCCLEEASAALSSCPDFAAVAGGVRPEKKDRRKRL